MRSFRLVHAWIAAAGLALTLSAAAPAQRNGGSAGAQPNPPPTMPNPPLSPLGADDAVTDRTVRLEREQEKVRNEERQKKLVADTTKLLALATELKANVDKTNKDMLSVDVIRKAEEIEKLAHSVKEKMKGS